MCCVHAASTCRWSRCRKRFPEDDSRELARRYRAIQRFVGSLYYRTVVGQDAEDGESTEDCDAAVAQILDDKEVPPRTAMRAAAAASGESSGEAGQGGSR